MSSKYILCFNALYIVIKCVSQVKTTKLQLLLLISVHLLYNCFLFSYDEEWVELVVLGRPARPEGPLEVSNITAEGCKLRWKPPADDGGMPIQEYEIEMLCPKTKKWIRKGKVKMLLF